MLSWTADAAPGSQTVYLEIRDLSTPDEFILQIRVSEVADLYGVALDVVYPSNALEFQPDDTDAGDFFPANDTFDTELQIVEEPDGRLIIGYTRLGEVRGRTGSGLLLLLRFTTTADGSSDISIESRLAVDREGTPVPTTWLGGTVQVQR
ncbi:MAG: cohesin domain-containing protein [Acidobacteria bacterium]|nr:cohesin domain-containing protein [Acidobacteriota bacterium]